MIKFFTYINLAFLLMLSILFLKPPSAYAVTASNINYAFFQSQTDLDSALSSVTCTGCSLPFTQCWNDQTPGQTACGTKQGCVDPSTGLPEGNSWAYYSFNSNNCRLSDASTNTCTAGFVFTSPNCSTADKYNGSPDFPGGDLTEARYGDCSCSAGAIYKTCCSNGSPTNTYNYTAATGQGNPLHPDAGCAGTSFPQCGGAGQPTCGTAACAGPSTPTPIPPPGNTCAGTALSCTNPQCPSGWTLIKLSNGNYVCSQGSTLDCNGTSAKPFCPSNCPSPTSSTSGWTGESCTCGSGNVPQACASSPSVCNSCSLKYCLQYAGTQCCYYKDPTCFTDQNNCQNLNCGGGNCIPGSVQTTCSAANVCPAP